MLKAYDFGTNIFISKIYAYYIFELKIRKFNIK